MQHYRRVARSQTLGADRLLGLAFGGKRHQHGPRFRGKNIQDSVVTGLADRDMTRSQQRREVAAEALDDNASGGGVTDRLQLGIGGAGAGEDAPAFVRETALPARLDRGVEQDAAGFAAA